MGGQVNLNSAVRDKSVLDICRSKLPGIFNSLCQWSLVSYYACTCKHIALYLCIKNTEPTTMRDKEHKSMILSHMNNLSW